MKMNVKFQRREGGQVMNLLINEPPLQVLPTLAKKVGLNEAIILQQIHFKLLISKHVFDGHKWIYNTYKEWHNEFPFWSERTIMRTFKKLEELGYLISTDQYNKIRQDKTKWYRLNYSKLGYGQNGNSIVTNCQYGLGQNGNMDCDNLAEPLPKNIKNNKKNNVEKLDLVREIIDYLNKKANKNYRPTTTATKKHINARLNEGFTLADFKAVIDVKCRDWLHDPKMNKYLRPETLFGSKFESYLNEAPKNTQKTYESTYQPPVLDFRAGEDV